ncbi:MAG: 3-dehydroquinate synthase II [Candidatus Thalassarchaeaceae archaeon]|nr:3-dehydroquinate synthase II [Candidatus Thalassarchaeaceae archaeon]
MQLWVEATPESSLFVQADRVWTGTADDVAVVQLDDYNGQEEAISLIGMIPWILIKCSDWTMIPLENIVAAASGSGTKIAVAISKEVDLRGAAFALEHGVDAILLPDDEELWLSAVEVAGEREKVTENKETNSILEFAKVTSVESGGVGERVCVDLIERLNHDEGMLIGSSANALALIHGETIPSQFVPSRPFRVNAGAVHAYCLMADGSTRYLSELGSGDKVAIIDSSGTLREASIGRLKIERRPFLLVRFEASGLSGQVMAQQAETVRLISQDNLISVTSLKEGDQFLVRFSSGMRHIGRELTGVMNER